jgi:hypothetical protein
MVALNFVITYADQPGQNILFVEHARDIPFSLVLLFFSISVYGVQK